MCIRSDKSENNRSLMSLVKASQGPSPQHASSRRASPREPWEVTGHGGHRPSPAHKLYHTSSFHLNLCSVVWRNSCSTYNKRSLLSRTLSKWPGCLCPRGTPEHLAAKQEQTSGAQPDRSLYFANSVGPQGTARYLPAPEAEHQAP